MIYIKRLDFQNYRKAGTYSLSFDDSRNGYHMYGIIAANGTGKTTILNAITWCLYEKEYQLKDESTALPIINSKKLNEMNLDESVEVSVKLTIQDEDKEIVFERKIKVIRSQKDNGVPCAILDTRSDFVVTVSDLLSSDSTKSYSNEEGQYYVAEYFENSIHDFFFFDGEKLEEFFTLKKATSIQASVEAIAQISLLDTVMKNSGEIATGLVRKVAKSRPNLKKLEKESDEVYKAWQDNINSKRALEIKKEDAVTQKRNIDVLLRENSSSASLQREKKLLEAETERIRNKQKELYKRKVKFAIKSVTLVKLYPRIIKALKLIDEKGASGDYSVLLSKKQLQNILSDAISHSTNCPLCGSGFGGKQIAYLQDIISRQTVDDDTSYSLRSLKEDLETAKREILAFRKSYTEIEEKEIQLQDILDETEQQYITASEKLSRLGTARNEKGEVIDFSKLESDSRKLEADISTHDQAIGALNAIITNYENKYIRKKNEYEEAVKKENEDADSQKVIDTLHFINNNMSCVKNSITQEVRENLEKITWEIFSKVVKRKGVFGSISIDEAYRLSLYDEYGQEMTGSSCATEYMILAYAYTLAIHEASGHNCPLVIDSPLGRVSGEIRENTADMLLETSRNKQIIMLFTEDEYSEKVRKLFDGKSMMQTIKLSADNKTWEGAEI